MPAPSANEQYLLELINDTRLNPLGNAARYILSYSPLQSNISDIQSALTFFQVSGAALSAEFSVMVPTGPVAWNDALATAAFNHSQAMIAADSQSHQLPGEPSLGQRVQNAGYNWASLAENIFAFSQSPLHAHAGFMVDWGFGPNGMQNPPGHRLNIMNSSYREVGLSLINESNPATSVGPIVTTEDFGTRFSSAPLILGVAYSDLDSNLFYSPGEGLGTLTVSHASSSSMSSASGGYTLELSPSSTGQQTVTLTGAGLAGPVSVSLDLASSSNTKIDVVDGNLLRISASASVSGPVGNIVGLGLGDLSLQATDGTPHVIIGTPGSNSLTGGSGSDELFGGSGADTLDGGPNIDTANFSGLRSAYTIIKSGSGASITGPDGNDTFVGVEFLRFGDVTERFRPGIGTTVDFNAHPSTYMAAIRDFDGNNLGAHDGWLRIGAADVQLDGDLEHVYVNRTIGRWATLGPAEDGLVYFGDHGWAGDTRVVGVYIDPLVEAGIVAMNSDHDGQRRFQNDLLIENINDVLSTGDFDHDGLQEVYFGLTDETAYLHAYMHADGNIRYANYQSETQVIDFLSSNGFTPSDWNGWLY